MQLPPKDHEGFPYRNLSKPDSNITIHLESIILQLSVSLHHTWSGPACGLQLRQYQEYHG